MHLKKSPLNQLMFCIQTLSENHRLPDIAKTTKQPGEWLGSKKVVLDSLRVLPQHRGCSALSTSFQKDWLLPGLSKMLPVQRNCLYRQNGQ